MAARVSSGSQLLSWFLAFSPASTSSQAIAALAAVGAPHRAVEHVLRGAPDVGAGSVALDEGNDRLGGDLSRPSRMVIASPREGLELSCDRVSFGRGLE